jgi:hypothetical protein
MIKKLLKSKTSKSHTWAPLKNFLEKENILTKFQLGFRKSHSTAHAMVHFLNNISKALTLTLTSESVYGS